MKIDPTLKLLGSMLRERINDVTQIPLPPDMVDTLRRVENRKELRLSHERHAAWDVHSGPTSHR